MAQRWHPSRTHPSSQLSLAGLSRRCASRVGDAGLTLLDFSASVAYAESPVILPIHGDLHAGKRGALEVVPPGSARTCTARSRPAAGGRGRTGCGCSRSARSSASRRPRRRPETTPAASPALTRRSRCLTTSGDRCARHPRNTLETTIAELVPGSPWAQTVARLRACAGSTRSQPSDCPSRSATRALRRNPVLRSRRIRA
jgi:hypothetical protein